MIGMSEIRTLSGIRPDKPDKQPNRARPIRVAMTEWALLRIWHVEMMDVAVGLAAGYRFMRTSFLSAPSGWRTMSTSDIAARVETVLAASYKLRNYMRTDDDHSCMELLGFWFEWVEDADTAPDPTATTAPFLLPKTFADVGLARKVVADLDAKVQQPRLGLASHCYANGFERFRVDVNNDWLILDPAEAKALFAERHEA